MALAPVHSAQVPGGSSVDQLIRHPRLPLIAGVDTARPALHLWEFGAAGLRLVHTIDADAAPYPPETWKRYRLIPSVAWHPHEPSLVLAGEGGVSQWTRDGISSVSAIGYRCVAFSPDGESLWASPASSADEGPTWERSDVIDLASGAVRSGPRWDTGVVEHPGGGLVVTLASDQSTTSLLFARVEDGRMRVLRHAIVLDADGYKAPVFSTDGRSMAIRGGAYGQTLDVFELPALRRVLGTSLGDPFPGYPYPPEWLAEQATWSSHNIAFAASGALLVATPQGRLIEIDLDGDQVQGHDVCQAPISALTALPTGHLVIADRSGQLIVLSDASPEAAPGAMSARERVEAFLATTTPLPDDANLDTDLVRTDGVRTWSPDDLESVTEADDADPPWLQLQAAINAYREAQQ